MAGPADVVLPLTVVNSTIASFIISTIFSIKEIYQMNFTSISQLFKQLYDP